MKVVAQAIVVHLNNSSYGRSSRPAKAFQLEADYYVILGEIPLHDGCNDII